ncbi:MAG: hypothetical protein RL033_2674 [Pseudomonadota bacterium]|jgi:hypothetical protein
MNSKLLVDAIVRQTTVLIAQVCTAAGVRGPLAHIADQVFLGLSREIEAQGVGRKIVADMFGMALRSYQKKVQRLAESASVQDSTLWEAILDFLRDRGGVPRKEVFARFARDDESAVAAVLNDLVCSGLAYATGQGGSALYGLTSVQDRERLAHGDQEDSASAMLWLVVYREGPIDAATLDQRLGLGAEQTQEYLALLEREGRIQRDPHSGAYSSAAMLVPVGARMGWEAAVFDHFQAVSKAIAAKLRVGAQSGQNDVIGGATLSFDLHPTHPLRDEAYGLLRDVRARVNDLWKRVSDHNRQHPVDEDELIKLTFYMGQNVESGEPRSGSEEKQT